MLTLLNCKFSKCFTSKGISVTAKKEYVYLMWKKVQKNITFPRDPEK